MSGTETDVQAMIVLNSAKLVTSGWVQRARLRSCLCDFWCDGDTTGCCGKDLVFTDFETYIFSTSVGSGANVITDVTLVGLAAWHDNVGGPSCCVVCAVEHMASRER